MSDKAEEIKSTSFHWAHGRYFRRLSNGSVQIARIMRDIDGEERLVDLDVISASEWASIVAVVSQFGATETAYQRALEFHGKP